MTAANLLLSHQSSKKQSGSWSPLLPGMRADCQQPEIRISQDSPCFSGNCRRTVLPAVTASGMMTWGVCGTGQDCFLAASCIIGQCCWNHCDGAGGCGVSLEKAHAIVIRQADFSESSRVITFFSREFGRFSALAKGAKRLKGPFDAALDLLSEGRIVFIRRPAGVLNLLTEARLTTRFQPQQPGVSDGLLRMYAGCYVAELLNGLTEDFDAAPEIFDLATALLQGLSTPECHVSALIIHFEMSLLQLIGLLPDLSSCSVCGGSIEPAGRFVHWVSQGGLLCQDCRKEEYSGTSVSAGAVEILRRLTGGTTDLAGRVRLTPAQAEECHRLAVSAISHVLGRRPQTLRYLQFSSNH